MQLSDSQAIDAIKDNYSKAYVLDGMQYESRLRIMTETLFKRQLEQEHAYYEMRAIMTETLGDKANRVMDFMNYPLNVLNITNDCILDVYRVFDARNASFETKVENATAQERINIVLSQINVRKFIEKEGKNVLKNAPNTFVIVDKDLEGNVYLEILRNSEVLCLEWDDKDCSKVKHIAFNHSEMNGVKKVGFYDAFSYRVFEVNNGVYTLVTNNHHKLGYCPVTPFLNQRLSSKDKFNRYNPFATSLNNLLRWTLFDGYMNYGEHMVGFPLMEKPKSKCSNDDCDSGLVRVPLENGQVSYSDCPVCKKNSGVLGPGSIIEIDVANYDDEKDASGKFKFISPPTENSEFIQKQQDGRENKIKQSVTGVSQVMEKEAVNREQVVAVMESARKPLMFIANMLNELHKFLEKTIVLLDTGLTPWVHANYGTEWYLLDESSIQKLFLDSKNAGLPDSELMQLYRLLIETKYKGDPENINRLIIELELNPAPFKTMDECYKMQEKGIMTIEDLAVKANLTALIQRFERENGSIVSFGKDAISNGKMSFSNKIDKIYNILKSYVTINEQNNSEQSKQQLN